MNREALTFSSSWDVQNVSAKSFTHLPLLKQRRPASLDTTVIFSHLVSVEVLFSRPALSADIMPSHTDKPVVKPEEYTDVYDAIRPAKLAGSLEGKVVFITGAGELYFETFSELRDEPSGTDDFSQVEV